MSSLSVSTDHLLISICSIPNGEVVMRCLFFSYMSYDSDIDFVPCSFFEKFQNTMNASFYRYRQQIV